MFSGLQLPHLSVKHKIGQKIYRVLIPLPRFNESNSSGVSEATCYEQNHLDQKEQNKRYYAT
jgi:hypothetical protein